MRCKQYRPHVGYRRMLRSPSGSPYHRYEQRSFADFRFAATVPDWSLPLRDPGCRKWYEKGGCVEGVSGASVAAALSQEYPVVKLGNRMRCDVLARFPEGKPPWRRVSLRVVSSMRIGHGF